jgi:hypothetical protein
LSSSRFPLVSSRFPLVSSRIVRSPASPFHGGSLQAGKYGGAYSLAWTTTPYMFLERHCAGSSTYIVAHRHMCTGLHSASAKRRSDDVISRSTFSPSQHDDARAHARRGCSREKRPDCVHENPVLCMHEFIQNSATRFISCNFTRNSNPTRLRTAAPAEQVRNGSSWKHGGSRIDL